MAAPLMRAAFGVGCVATAGAAVSYISEQHQLSLRKAGLQQDILRLSEEAALRRQRDQRDRRALEEEIAVGEEGMANALTSLWQERLRRWQDTGASDELISTLPWLYWQWNRIGSWYKALGERFAKQSDDNIGEYEIVTLKLMEMMLPMRLEAYRQEDRLLALPSVLGTLTQVAPSDPLFRLLEGSVRHLTIKPLRTVAPLLQGDLSDAILSVADHAAASEAPSLSGHADALREVGTSLRSVRLEGVEDTGSAMAAVLQAKRQLQAYLASGKSQGVDLDSSDAVRTALSEVTSLGASLESYAMAQQASSVLDAHMATLCLSFAPRPPRGGAGVEKQTL